eukprot:321139-Prymnesium_polylepis.1
MANFGAADGQTEDPILPLYRYLDASGGPMPWGLQLDAHEPFRPVLERLTPRMTTTIAFVSPENAFGLLLDAARRRPSFPRGSQSQIPLPSDLD